MKCPVCSIGEVRKNNLTCGARGCVAAHQRRTRAETDPVRQLAEMKRMYGDANPWVQWLGKALAK